MKRHQQQDRDKLDRLLAFGEEYVIAVLRQALSKPHEELAALKVTLAARTALLDLLEELDDG